MFSAAIRTSVIIALACMIVSISSAQGPPRAATHQSGDKPSYTAFPQFKPAMKERRVGRDTFVEVDFDKLPERLFRPYAIPVSSDEPVHRQVILHQVNEGFAYLSEVVAVIKKGRWTSDDLGQLMYFATEVYRVAATAESTLAGRLPWFEDRVQALKMFEAYTHNRVKSGNDPPTSLQLVRYRRLQAEVDLLKLMADVEKEGKKQVAARANTAAELCLIAGGVVVVSALAPRASVDRKEVKFQYRASPCFTAFLNITAPPLERRNELPLQLFAPSSAPDDSPLRTVRLERIRECVTNVRMMKDIVDLGRWNPREYLDYSQNLVAMYRAIAELETSSIERLEVHQALLIHLKNMERFAEIRTQTGNDPPQNLNHARFMRLGAEANLLEVIREATNAGIGPQRTIRYDNIIAMASQEIAISALERIIPRTQLASLAPAYKAFPDLEVVPYWRDPVFAKDGGAARKHYEAKIQKRVFEVLPSIVPSDATPLRRAQLERIREGIGFLQNVRELVDLGQWSPVMIDDSMTVILDLFRCAAAFAASPGERVKCLEAGVILLRDFESRIEIRVKVGNDPPQRIHLVRSLRLSAETTLLEAKEEIEKTKKK